MSIIQNLLAAIPAAAAAATDAYFYLVTLLLPGNGTNGAQNNTFLDSSTNAFSITRNGNTTQGNFSPFSQTGWSNYFDNVGDYLSIANNSALQISSSDMTIEAWVYSDGSQEGDDRIIGKSSGYSEFSLFWQSATQIRFVATTNGTSWTVDMTANSVPANQWVHVAVTRSGSNWTIWINGVSSATGTQSGTVTTNTAALVIGGDSASNNFKGYISNARLVKGTAVYTAAFTPPTSPLTAITNTSLLTCQSNRFVDNSTNAFAITVNGNPSVQAFSPFNPTAAWSAATNGGSGYFDGTGDSLLQNTASNWTFISSGASDWTIEFDVYYSSTSQLSILDNSNATSSNYGFTVSINNDTAGKVDLQIRRGVTGSNAIFRSNAALKTNQWNHVAITFTSSTKTATFYINGVQEGSTAQSGFSYTSTTPSYGLYVGTFAATSGYDFSGYLANLRISDTLRTGLTTVPTAPYTSDGNTKLLLNFTNAGITDATAKNDLETVGNAQISTAQSKFGGSSMYFDGTGDRLVALASENLRASGNFTVECWVYLNSNSGDQTITAYSNTSGQSQWALSVGLITSGKASFYWVNTSPTGFNATSTTTIPTSQWVHLAGTLDGTTLRIFVNGTLEATTTISGSARSPSSPLLYVGYSGVGADLNGYVNDLRITKGIARYTANFTAPTAAFPLQ